jgi:hypothetical protein
MSAHAHSARLKKASTMDRIGSSVPHHPIIGDAFARALVDALVDCDALGIALVRGPPWLHVMVNARYQAIVGMTPALGRAVGAILPKTVVPDVLLEDVQRTGVSRTVRDAALHHDDGSGEPRAYATFTFLRVTAPDTGDDAVLVLARDVTEEVHERRTANLFVLLAEDIASARDAPGTIRNALRHAVEALDADDASIFLLSADGHRLDGALVGWDWTRTSFAVELEKWPTVQSAIEWQAAVYFCRERAQKAERGWFERRGIAATVCAPMSSSGRVVGVIFFDFVEAPCESNVDLGLAKGVADQCAVVLSRELTTERLPPPIEWDDSVPMKAWSDATERHVADVASIVRAVSTRLERAAEDAGVTVVSWTPEVTLADIPAALFEEALLLTANALLVWIASEGHVSINLLSVGADVNVVLVATSLSSHEPFAVPARVSAILEPRSGSVTVEAEEAWTTRVTLRLGASSASRRGEEKR